MELLVFLARDVLGFLDLYIFFLSEDTVTDLGSGNSSHRSLLVKYFDVFPLLAFKAAKRPDMPADVVVLNRLNLIYLEDIY